MNFEDFKIDQVYLQHSKHYLVKMEENLSVINSMKCV